MRADPTRSRAMNPGLLLIVCAGLMVSAASAQAEVLRGHFSGLGPNMQRVDIRIRFYRGAHAEQQLAEMVFHGVELRNDEFAVWLQTDQLPWGGQFAEIALRDSKRRYAEFQVVPPRRHIANLSGVVWMAHVSKRP